MLRGEIEKNIKLKKEKKNYPSKLELTCQTYNLGHEIEIAP
jgi:hypothetical protein